MTFFSPEFLVAFIIFLLIYWSLKSFVFAQKILILVASYAFVCSLSWNFALILAVYTGFSYLGGKVLQERGKMERELEKARELIDELRASKKNKDLELCANNEEVKSHGKMALLAFVSFGVLFLCFFKYYEELQSYFALFASFFGLQLLESVAFPLGISYYTFMSITYFVAMYKGECEGSDDFISLACYLSFLPSVVMGPIGRASDCREFKAVLPQFNKEKIFARSDEIFTLFIFASIKLLVISGHLMPYVDSVFSGVYGQNPESSCAQIILATLLYGIALYANFSGFIDMARALGLCLGFELPQNFKMPYMARNLSDFWERWHITLSTFVRDYIYIPLGGSRCSFAKTQLNVMIAFALSGIWHGAGLGFLFWGILHGLGLVVFNIYKNKINKPLNYYFSVFLTYIYVSFAWLFFANSFDDVINIFNAFGVAEIYTSYMEIVLIILVILSVLFYHRCEGLFGFVERNLSVMGILPKALVLGLIFTLVFALMPSGIPSFIYASF